LRDQRRKAQEEKRKFEKVGTTGTSLNTSSGVVSGTTTAAGTYNFSITATDHLGNTAARSFTVVVSVAASGGSYVFIG